MTSQNLVRNFLFLTKLCEIAVPMSTHFETPGRKPGSTNRNLGPLLCFLFCIFLSFFFESFFTRLFLRVFFYASFFTRLFFSRLFSRGKRRKKEEKGDLRREMETNGHKWNTPQRPAINSRINRLGRFSSAFGCFKWVVLADYFRLQK